MRKLCNLILFVLVMVMCFSVTVFAEETSYDVSAAGDGSVMATFDSETGTLTVSGNGPMADYTGTYPYPGYMTHEGEIKKIVIEEGVTRIGTYAFYMNEGVIEELDIFPSTLESVGSYAFYSFNYQKDLVIPGTVKTIESNAFYGGTYSTITLENGVESIGAFAFYNCDGVTKISIPESVSLIGDDVFGDMSYVSEFVCLVNKAQVFEGMFSGGYNDTPRFMGYFASTKIATVCENQYYLIETLEALGYTVNTVSGQDLEPWESYPTGTLGGATYVTEIGANGDNVIAALNLYSGSMNLWGSGATTDWSSNKKGYGYTNYNPIAPLLGYMKTIEIEEGITEIGRETFSFTTSYAPKNVTSISLPSSLTRIGYKAFCQVGESSTLAELTIPESVETIDASAFESARISTIYNLAEKGQTVDTSAFNGLAGSPTVYQYSTNTAMETAVTNYASEIVYLDDDSVVLSGTLDNGITWEYDPATKTLTFTGEGEIPDYEDGSQPWYGAATQYGGIGTYNFGDGITGIGAGIFGSYGNGAYGSDGSGATVYGPTGLNYGGAAYAGSSSGGGGSSGGDAGDDSTDDDNTVSGSNDSTMIIVNADPTNFLVTVPIKVVVTMDAEGNIDCGSGYYVENDCAMGPVIITDIKVVAETKWSIVDWTSDFHNMKASSKNIALTINGVEVGSGGNVIMNDSLSSVIRNKEQKELTFEAKLPAQRSALQENAAAVVFTVDFDKV